MLMMDYHALHGHDVSSFDLPSTHRLPTVSAAEALQALEEANSPGLITGLPSLDASLDPVLGSGQGGIQKGHVTEVWGPPGAGKTALGIQLAAHCLNQRGRVLWVDGFHRLPIERLRSVLGKATGEGDGADLGRLDGFTHYMCPTLPHLIALLCRPTGSCIPPGTSLVVVDSLSALVNHAFPKLPEARAAKDANVNKGPSAHARRMQVLHHIIGSFQKLAATRDLAVVVLTQCATKMQAERGATLTPAINANVWEQGMSSRLVLFRDWLGQSSDTPGAHLAALQKLNGKMVRGPIVGICAFRVTPNGLVAVEDEDGTQSRTLDSNPAQKRKLGETDFEVADSEDEEYGWDDDDELPPMPSQWQGSEDLLLTREPGRDSDDDEDEGDEDPSDTKNGDNQGPADVESPPEGQIMIPRSDS